MSAQTVLITGGTSGIGHGIAKAFAAAGYNLVLNGLEKDGAQITQAVADEAKVKAVYSPANMMDVAQIEEMMKLAETTFGGVDVLVNCAGIQVVSPIVDFPPAKWDAIIAINLSSTFHTTRLAWKYMADRKFGRIINIASAHGLVASPFKSAYVAAKHGMVGFTKTAALEGAELGITANTICPGYVHTPLVDAQIKDQAKAHNMTEAEVVPKVLLDKQAIKQFVTVEQLGALAVFLASDAAKMITGTAIPVDGGWTAE